MGSLLYILDENNNPKPIQDPRQWNDWMRKTARRKVKAEKILFEEVEIIITISTVFMGMDYGFLEKNPLLFETMVFQGDAVDSIQRYYTWDQAMKGHDKITKTIKDRIWVKKVLSALPQEKSLSVEDSDLILKTLVSQLKETHSNN